MFDGWRAFVRGEFATINSKLDQLLAQGVKEMAALDDLTTQVTASVGAEQSAITLIQGLHAAILAAGTDPTKLAALTSQLATSQAALAAAVAANPAP